MNELIKQGVMKMLLSEKERFRQKLVKSSKILREELQVEDTTDSCVTSSVINEHRTGIHAKVLIKFDLAMARVTVGTYGTCTKCGEQISLGRLKQVPFTETCIICKNLAEATEKKRGSQTEEGFGLYYRPASPKLSEIFFSSPI